MTEVVANGGPPEADVSALLAHARAVSHGPEQLAVLERVHDVLRGRLAVASRE